MNILGLFGTHGVGKTTICKELEKRGWNTNTRSVPRAAQAHLGWERLSIVEESELNLWAMQDTTLKILITRDTRINEQNLLTFVDRTPVDLVGYLTLWAQRRDWKIDMDRYAAYVEACRVQCELYRHQFYIPMCKEIPFVAELNRGDEAGREANADAMCRFVNEQAISYHNIHCVKVEERADEIEGFIGVRGEVSVGSKKVKIVDVRSKGPQ